MSFLNWGLIPTWQEVRTACLLVSWECTFHPMLRHLWWVLGKSLWIETISIRICQRFSGLADKSRMKRTDVIPKKTTRLCRVEHFLGLVHGWLVVNMGGFPMAKGLSLTKIYLEICWITNQIENKGNKTLQGFFPSWNTLDHLQGFLYVPFFSDHLYLEA